MSQTGPRSVILLGGAVIAACTPNMHRIQDPPRAVAVTSGATWTSMTYLARTDSGVVVIDLGWMGAERALRRGLAQLGARPADVTDVFLTHSHRDHVAGWQMLRHARFRLTTPEVPRFLGDSGHGGLTPRLAEAVRESDLPERGELHTYPFTGDTAFVFGRDTLRAFVVYGHTAGSAAYLFRGVLFIGDAVSYQPVVGFHSAWRHVSDDAARARASLAALRRRVARYDPRLICTAHGKCAAPDYVWERALGEQPPER